MFANFDNRYFLIDIVYYQVQKTWFVLICFCHQVLLLLVLSLKQFVLLTLRKPINLLFSEPVCVIFSYFYYPIILNERQFFFTTPDFFCIWCCCCFWLFVLFCQMLFSSAILLPASWIETLMCLFFILLCDGRWVKNPILWPGLCGPGCLL